MKWPWTKKKLPTKFVGYIEPGVNSSGATYSAKELYPLDSDICTSGLFVCSGSYPSLLIPYSQPIQTNPEPIQADPEWYNGYRCPWCNSLLIEGDRYCIGCGHPV